MALEKFEEIAFRKKTRVVIDQANVILGEMAAGGYTLTVRQLYYQFVARDLLANTQANYKRLAGIVDDARKAGLIDWDAIEDRTRYLRSITAYAGPENFLTRQVRNYYAENLWASQDTYCEVWVEKDALLGVVERPALEWRVPYFACRGYASSSELYEAGKRLARHKAAGKRVVIFHLGDHDPSGLNMTDVNRDSLRQFGRTNGVEVRRLALNMDQVEEHEPPPNPAKDTDARFAGYAEMMEAHGYEDPDDVPSWELDALEPAVIDQLIRDAIEEVVDQEAFQAARDEEAANQEKLMEAARHWDEVHSYLTHRHHDHPDTGLWPATFLQEVADHHDNLDPDEDEPEDDEAE